MAKLLAGLVPSTIENNGQRWLTGSVTLGLRLASSVGRQNTTDNGNGVLSSEKVSMRTADGSKRSPTRRETPFTVRALEITLPLMPFFPLMVLRHRNNSVRSWGVCN
eukprot:2938622-Pyramimonas_sp.AAC.1